MITIEAIYEGGVLKPKQEIPLKERERVWITIQRSVPEVSQTHEEIERVVQGSFGLLGWKGDVETLRRVAEDPEYSVRETL